MITLLTYPHHYFHPINRVIRVALVILSLVLPFFAVSAQAQPTADKTTISLRFALLTFEDKQNTQRLWQPIIQQLEHHLNQSATDQKNYRMTLAVYYLDELTKVIEQEGADLVLTQPSQYLTFAQQHKLSTPLVSLLRREADQVTDRFGGVIFTRADRDDITVLEQLKGKSIAVTHTKGLGSYQMQAFELQQKKHFLNRQNTPD